MRPVIIWIHLLLLPTSEPRTESAGRRPTSARDELPVAANDFMAETNKSCSFLGRLSAFFRLMCLSKSIALCKNYLRYRLMWQLVPVFAPKTDGDVSLSANSLLVFCDVTKSVELSPEIAMYKYCARFFRNLCCTLVFLLLTTSLLLLEFVCKCLYLLLLTLE